MLSINADCLVWPIPAFVKNSERSEQDYDWETADFCLLNILLFSQLPPFNLTPCLLQYPLVQITMLE